MNINAGRARLVPAVYFRHLLASSDVPGPSSARICNAKCKITAVEDWITPFSAQTFFISSFSVRNKFYRRQRRLVLQIIIFCDLCSLSMYFAGFFLQTFSYFLMVGRYSIVSTNLVYSNIIQIQPVPPSRLSVWYSSLKLVYFWKISKDINKVLVLRTFISNFD